MKPGKEALLECGRILKNVAPILGISINELEEEFSVEISKITGTIIGKERIHKLFCGELWPVQYYGISESYLAIEGIAKSVLSGSSLYEEKIKEIKRIVYTAFSDYEHLSYFYSRSIGPDANTKIADMVERIMDDLDRFQNNEFLYVFHKYLRAFLSINFLELDILTLEFKYEMDYEIPVSIQRGFNLLSDPVLQQWLELRNNDHKDALRKVKEPQLERIKTNLKKQLAKLGFGRLIPLTCFIEEFLLRKKQGIWSAVSEEDLDRILVCKYIIGANEKCLHELKSSICDKKIEQALNSSNGIANFDLAKISGIIWIDCQF